MKKGDIIEGTVEGISFGDKGRVRTPEGELIICKGVLPGQVVQVRVLRKKAGTYKGMLLKVLKEAPGQCKSRCPHFPGCGGCTYQHYDINLTESMKEAQVKSLLKEHIKDEDLWLPAVMSPTVEGYRNKMEFTFGDSVKDGPLELGLHKKGSFYDIITVDGCRIVHEDYRIILRKTIDYFRQCNLPYFHRRDHKGYLRHLLVRRSHYSGELLIGLVTTTQENPDLSGFVDCIMNAGLSGKIAGIIHIKNDSLSDAIKCDSMDILYGQDYFYEKILGLTFKVSLFSFFQTNTPGAERLYETARDFIGTIEGKPVIYDLYSGTGTIAQLMAPCASRVYGVEIVESAVMAARENAGLNGLDNCRFIAGDVLKELDNIKEKPDLIILDPPREGVHPKALSKIISYGVDKILYISCKPTSLANDLQALTAGGYQPVKIRTVSMFPSTVHVETVCLLGRRKPDDTIKVSVNMDDYYQIRDAEDAEKNPS